MIINIKKLNFTYESTNTHVIKDFDLEIKEGKIVAILGQSGSGKSTLLRLISGLEIPSSGEIKIHDQIVFDNEKFIEPEKRGIGFVFQDYALFPHMTVEKNIMYGLKGKNKKDKIERVNELLKLVNLPEIKKRYPYELSGGQQQRIALARALAPNPALLLLDEPFSNLDTNLKQKIRNELRLILKEANITSIFVTHDRVDANVLADQIVFLNQGNIEKKITLR
ncbi:ABC transporter ATP-binding protein [Mycoplasmatota bacterium]|nr:ABC transporter ATP-binding protein [Mycoplasmatota bacterium]